VTRFRPDAVCSGNTSAQQRCDQPIHGSYYNEMTRPDVDGFQLRQYVGIKFGTRHIA
jgi:hypothetical protein